MNVFNFIAIFSVTVLSVFLYKLMNYRIITICEIDKCPYCFGTDLCDEFELNNFALSKTSFRDIFANYLSVKNVFYARYKNSSVVLKKLVHNIVLNRLDTLICMENTFNSNCNLKQIDDQQEYLIKIFDFLTRNTSEINNFKICSVTTATKFINLIQSGTIKTCSSQEVLLKNIWTILQLNVEPLLIQLLRLEDDWPVPHYFGACGRVIVESDCGSNLNDFASASWHVRANLALQLLRAAENFTERHPEFRFYLTDISPDNIAVDSNLKISFIDLENVLVVDKAISGGSIHNSIDIEMEHGFAFSEAQICGSILSDHNYYAVCKLLLSKEAPWPMMKGGLLHSTPADVAEAYPHLFKAIETCTIPLEDTNRFKAFKKVIEILEKVLL